MFCDIAYWTPTRVALRYISYSVLDTLKTRERPVFFWQVYSNII